MKKDFATFLTHSGVEIDIQNVKEEDVNVNDIFHSLSMINRFCGHSNRPYSVAEHSVYCYVVADLLGLSKRIKAYALLHDASESMIGDMPTYVKQFIPKYKEIENTVEDVIYSKLGLGNMGETDKATVKAIDNTMMLIEMRDLTQHDIAQIDLIERDNYYSARTESKGAKARNLKMGLTDIDRLGKPVKELIDLEFVSIANFLSEEYALTFKKYEHNYPLAYEMLMKHIYKREFSGMAGDLK